MLYFVLIRFPKTFFFMDYTNYVYHFPKKMKLQILVIDLIRFWEKV